MKREQSRDIYKKMTNCNYSTYEETTTKDRTESTHPIYRDGKYIGEIPNITHNRGVQQGVQQGVQGIFKGCSREKAERSIDSQRGVWNLKTNRKAIENRYGVQRNTVVVFMTAVVLLCTVLEINIRILSVLYFTWFAVLFSCDPLGAIGRFLALPNRILISISCGSIALLICKPQLGLLFFSSFMLVVTVLCIKFLNCYWLAADSWSNTTVVQKALRKDPDSLAGKNWQADGKREVRTALAEMGITADQDSLDLFYRPSFEIGYLHGVQKQGQINANKKKLEQTQELMLQQQEELERAKQEINRLQKINNQVANQDKWKNLFAEERRKTEELERINIQLEQANKELLEYDQEQSEEQKVVTFVAKDQTKSDKKTLEADILDYHAAGFSIRKIAAQVGCSVGKVHSTIKKAEQQTAAL